MNTVTEAVALRVLPTGSAGDRGVLGGFAVSLRLGDTERTIAGTGGEGRIFVRLNTACDFVRVRSDIAKVKVDSKELDRVRLRKPRPDRSCALRNFLPASAHAAHFDANATAPSITRRPGGKGTKHG
jgi:hypothetical protein